MPPLLALSAWLVLLLLLLRFDPARDRQASPALWIPLIWIFFVASRLPSQWLGFQGTVSTAQAFQEGSPLDRIVWSVLMLAAMVVLVSRSFDWAKFVSRNRFLMAYLAFALASILWSDYPYITFKHWSRDVGDYLVILVVLSDTRPLEAVRTVLRRLSYLLIPLSIVVIKYFPTIGVSFDVWTGQPMYAGVTTGKNLLGLVCLVSTLFFLWDTLTRWADRRSPRTQRIILLNVVFLAMTLWLLKIAHSATSNVCLVIGCLVIAIAHSRFGKRRSGFLKLLAPASFFLYLILALGFGMMRSMAEAVGRSPTLTGRTDIWSELLSMHTNPFVGTGYQSFWLGPRLDYIWSTFGPGLMEAHNGYLGLYLDLGLVGLLLLCGFLIASYGAICKRLKPFTSLGSLSLALWTVMLFYNVTEASLEGGPLWSTFLMLAIAVPMRESVREAETPAFERTGVIKRYAAFS